MNLEQSKSTPPAAPLPGGLLRQAVDGPVELPLFDEKAWPFQRGYTPLGIRADECAVKGALLPERLSVTTLSGRLLAPGRDFRVDPEWGVVGLTPGAPREPVRLSYAYTEQRLDSLVEKDGQTTRRYGEPHVANPVPPALADGERRVENLLVTADGETRFPVLADAADAPRTVPNAESTIPRTLAKLRSGEPVTLLAWGDSVTDAAYLPEGERWQSQFARRLRAAFPKSEITLVTRGWGGRTIRNFLDAPSGDEHNFAETVLSARPDLVVSEFVNDAGFPPDMARELYGRVLADFRAHGIEWAILTPHYVRCDWMGLKGQTDCDDDPRPYTAFVRRFTRENGVGLADAALRWGHLWREGIPHETLLRNAINHPNTLGMSFYADALMDFLGL